MNIATVRADLASRLQTLSGLNVYPTVPANPQVPCAIVRLISVDPHSAFGPGVADVLFDAQVLVQLADWPSAQAALDGYASIATPYSVVDALETADGETVVLSIDNYGHITLGDVDYGTVTFHVKVVMSG